MLGRVVIALICVPLAMLLGQQTATGIRGRVTDEFEAPMQGGTVTLIARSEVVAQAKTGLDGAFTFPSIAPGQYEVLFIYPGFNQLRVPANTSVDAREVDLGRIVLTIPVQDESGQVIKPLGRSFRGRYQDPLNGFSVEIPAGIEGETLPSGFAIRFGYTSSIVVEASHQTPGSSEYPISLGAKLGKLPAERKAWKTLEIRCNHESIVARRSVGRNSVLYKIHFDTSFEYQDKTSEIFEALVKSFRTKPIRR